MKSRPKAAPSPLNGIDLFLDTYLQRGGQSVREITTDGDVEHFVLVQNSGKKPAKYIMASSTGHEALSYVNEVEPHRWLVEGVVEVTDSFIGAPAYDDPTQWGVGAEEDEFDILHTTLHHSTPRHSQPHLLSLRLSAAPLEDEIFSFETRKRQKAQCG